VLLFLLLRVLILVLLALLTLPVFLPVFLFVTPLVLLVLHFALKLFSHFLCTLLEVSLVPTLIITAGALVLLVPSLLVLVALGWAFACGVVSLSFSLVG
jgi:hypothetical protein